MIPFPEFFEAVEAIPYRYTHPRVIYSIIRTMGFTKAIEIGCHIGYTSCWMARAIQENGGGKLTCIDPFCWIMENQEEQWTDNVAECGVSGTVELIKARSQEAEWPEAEIVFVDGNHTYPVAKHDAEKARSIGARCVILHDTVAWTGSVKHADEVRSDPSWSGWDILEIPSECGMMILMKREPKPEPWGEDAGEIWDKPTSIK